MAAAFTRLTTLLQEPAWQETLQGDSLAPIYFITWLAPFTAEVQQAVTTRIRARLTTREDIETVAMMLRQLVSLPVDARPGDVEQLLRPHNRRPRVFLAALALTGDERVAAHIRAYFFHYRHVKTHITGDTLRQMGLKPGPQYGHILDGLLAARLNNQIETAADEQKWLNEWLARP
jgi:hypothetical protein